MQMQGDDNGKNYIAADKAAKKSMIISAAIVWGLVLIPATLLVILIPQLGTAGKVILAVTWAVAVMYVILVPHIRYMRYRYCIDEEAIRVKQGIAWSTEQIVPMERLHKIEVSQGPIARIFNLSTVRVTTAGGDVGIRFLKEERAEEIAEALKKKINDIALAERERQ